MLTLCNEQGLETSIKFCRKDNVVVIKRELSSIIYKNAISVELYDGDNKLDNNFYIPDGKSKFKYVVKNEIPNEIILKVAPNIFSIPPLLQVNRNEKLYDFKEKLRNLFKINEYIEIFIDHFQSEDSKTIVENNLFDESEIKICNEDDILVTLSVTDLVPRQEGVTITCHICNTVAEVKSEIRKKLFMENDAEIALFTDNDYLESEKRLIDYSIINGKLIFYVDLFRNEQVVVHTKDRNPKVGKFAEIGYGRVQSTGETVVLKKYNFKGNTIHNFKPLQSEIISLLKLRNENHPRIVQSVAMFERDSFFFIALEQMQGSLADCIPIEEEPLIIKYSIQILEALIYLHKEKIVFRNLKCSSVLLDGHNNVKLCNFHMSKYLMECNERLLMEGIYGSKPIEYNWAPVEMIAGEKYGTKADIWSFGATLIQMITGENPYNGLTSPEVRSRILKTKTIMYEHPENVSEEVKEIITKCLKSQEIRPVAAELLDIFKEMQMSNSMDS